MTLTISSKEGRIDFNTGDTLVHLDSNHRDFITVLGFCWLDGIKCLRVYQMLGVKHLWGPFEVIVSNRNSPIFKCANGTFLVQEGTSWSRQNAQKQRDLMEKRLEVGDSLSGPEERLLFCGETQDYLVFESFGGRIICEHKHGNPILTIGASCVAGKWYEHASSGNEVDRARAEYIRIMMRTIARELN